MIEFLSEDIRTLFHSLPVETQKEWMSLAAKYLSEGKVVLINNIEIYKDGDSEMDIRILKKFDV